MIKPNRLVFPAKEYLEWEKLNLMLLIFNPNPREIPEKFR